MEQRKRTYSKENMTNESYQLMVPPQTLVTPMTSPNPPPANTIEKNQSIQKPQEFNIVNSPLVAVGKLEENEQLKLNPLRCQEASPSPQKMRDDSDEPQLKIHQDEIQPALKEIDMPQLISVNKIESPSKRPPNQKIYTPFKEDNDSSSPFKRQQSGNMSQRGSSQKSSSRYKLIKPKPGTVIQSYKVKRTSKQNSGVIVDQSLITTPVKVKELADQEENMTPNKQFTSIEYAKVETPGEFSEVQNTQMSKLPPTSNRNSAKKQLIGSGEPAMSKLVRK